MYYIKPLDSSKKNNTAILPFIKRYKIGMRYGHNKNNNNNDDIRRMNMNTTISNSPNSNLKAVIIKRTNRSVSNNYRSVNENNKTFMDRLKYRDEENQKLRNKLTDIINIHHIKDNSKIRIIDKMRSEIGDGISSKFNLIKANTYKFNEIQNKYGDDTFINTTKSKTIIEESLDKFRGIFTLKTVKQYYKEVIVIMTHDTQHVSSVLRQFNILQISTIMLQYDIYPSVYFVADIWKTALSIVCSIVREKNREKGREEEERSPAYSKRAEIISNFFNAMKVYIQLNKLDKHNDIEIISTFYSSVYLHDMDDRIDEIDETILRSYIVYYGYMINVIEQQTLEESPPATRGLTIETVKGQLCIMRMLDRLQQEKRSEAYSSEWADRVAHKCLVLLFYHQISLSNTYHYDTTASMFVFMFVFHILSHPSMSHQITSRWYKKTQDDSHRDRGSKQEERKEDINIEDNSASGDNRSNVSLDINDRLYGLIELLMRLMGEVLHAQIALEGDSRQATDDMFVMVCIEMVEMIGKMFERGCVDDIVRHSNNRLTLEVLSRINVAMYDVSCGMRYQMPTSSTISYVDALVSCNVMIIKRSMYLYNNQKEVKKHIYSIVKNGCHEILSQFKSNRYHDERKDVVDRIVHQIITILQ